MNDEYIDQLLHGGKEASFGEIEAALAGMSRDQKTARPRASTATVVVVGRPAQLVLAADALEHLGDAGVRAILIAEGTGSRPAVRMTESAIAIIGLAPAYLNNAVAALRLPCLPAIVWWRGGSLQALEDITPLADRLVLDTENPDEVWIRATAFLDQTALTDLRWTRLTRWRALLAHVFDLPQVRGAVGDFRRLLIEAHDIPSGRLFAAWLTSHLNWSGLVKIEIQAVGGESDSVLESIQLIGGRLSVGIRMLPTRDCLEASVEGEHADVRVAPLGESTLCAWIKEELAVRSHDFAFERTLRALGKLVA